MMVMEFSACKVHNQNGRPWVRGIERRTNENKIAILNGKNLLHERANTNYSLQIYYCRTDKLNKWIQKVFRIDSRFTCLALFIENPFCLSLSLFSAHPSDYTTEGFPAHHRSTAHSYHHNGLYYKYMYVLYGLLPGNESTPSLFTQFAFPHALYGIISRCIFSFSLVNLFSSQWIRFVLFPRWW